MAVDDFLAWVYAAEGKHIAATHLLGQVEITARREGLPMPELVAGLDRAAIQSAMGEPAKAAKTLADTRAATSSTCPRASGCACGPLATR